MIINKETIAELARQGKRLDGRALTDYRQPIKIETAISWTASRKRILVDNSIIFSIRINLLIRSSNGHNRSNKDLNISSNLRGLCP